MHGTYFLYCKGFIKIGFSNHIEKRLVTLQGGNPHKLYLLGYIKNRWLERELHKKFSYCLHTREWFKVNLKILEYIKKNCDCINQTIINKIKKLFLKNE